MCLGLQPHSHRQTYVPRDASPSLLRVYRKSTFHTDAPYNVHHRDGNHSQNPPITSRIDWFQNSFLYYDHRHHRECQRPALLAQFLLRACYAPNLMRIGVIIRGHTIYIATCFGYFLVSMRMRAFTSTTVAPIGTPIELNNSPFSVLVTSGSPLYQHHSRPVFVSAASKMPQR